ncbi:MAG: hypothetical protein ABMA13_23065 [Chthoniobacteraceae bacterium]
MKQHVAASAAAAQKLTSVGMRVHVVLDAGASLDTTLESLPWQLGHGAWVANVRGINGGYDCARIRPAVEVAA